MENLEDQEKNILLQTTTKKVVTKKVVTKKVVTKKFPPADADGNFCFFAAMIIDADQVLSQSHGSE